MRTILINHYAGSPHYGMEYRPYYLAREWLAAGHQVTILAANYSHVRRVNPRDGLNQEEIEGIQYRWLKTSHYERNGVKRFINMLQFVSRLHHSARTLAESLHPDVVIASSTYPLDIIAASRLSRFARAKLVFELHDLWPLSPMEIGGMSRWNPFIMLMRWAEGQALQRADKVISMLPYAKNYLVSRGMAEEKFCHVPNGFYPDEWGGAVEPIDVVVSQKLSELRGRFPFLVGYAGSHGAANVLRPFVDAAARVRGRGIGIVLVGQGPEKASLMRAAQEQGSANVLFLDPVAKRQIPSLLRQFDAAYIGWRALSIYRHGVSPNKLFDYMMAERPIIHGINAENDMVAEAQCGLTIPAEDAIALAGACIKLAHLPGWELARMGRNGMQYAINNHDYRVLARRFEQAISAS